MGTLNTMQDIIKAIRALQSDVDMLKAAQKPVSPNVSPPVYIPPAMEPVVARRGRPPRTPAIEGSESEV